MLRSILLLHLLLVSGTISADKTAESSQSVRSLMDLRDMISESTGCQVSGSSGSSYGCYCGKSNNNNNKNDVLRPVDEVDAACMRHKRCYDLALSCWGCEESEVYGIWYGALGGGYYYDVKEKEIVCQASDNSKCKQQACLCDRNLTLAVGPFIRDADKCKSYQESPKSCDKSDVVKEDEDEEYEEDDEEGSFGTAADCGTGGGGTSSNKTSTDWLSGEGGKINAWPFSMLFATCIYLSISGF